MKVTIITVVRNNVKSIEDCIKSVIGQTHKDIEYVIIDKGSTDGTVDIVEKYKDRIAVFVSEKDEGAYYALNKGLQIASGDIIGILHSDDVYENEHVIERVVNIFKGSNSIQAVYADLVYVSKNDINKVIRYWHSGEYDENSFVNGWMPPHPTLFIRKKIYDQFGVYNTSFKICADYELILRFLYKHKIVPYYLPEVIVRMRVGGLSNKNPIAMMRKSCEDYKAWKSNGLKASLVTIFKKNIIKIPQFFIKG